jgi:hypothetical protein
MKKRISRMPKKSLFHSTNTTLKRFLAFWLPEKAYFPNPKEIVFWRARSNNDVISWVSAFSKS